MYPICNKDGHVIDYLPLDELINYIKTTKEQLYKENGSVFHKPLVQKTKFICHRINNVDELEKIPHIFGVEIDVREKQCSSYKLMLAHDPWVDGISFNEFLKSYHHSTLIVNIKSERIEYKCLDLLLEYEIQDFFFLDSSFPMMYSLYKQGERRFALRVSEYEPLASLPLEWVWVDCFTQFPLHVFDKLKLDSKKICIVSPELQGHPEKINLFRKQLIDHNIIPDAICCKFKYIYDWL